jgi:pimeloyl-ACP methyl ester carboxylesterase
MPRLQMLPLDPVPALHRPLCVYLLASLLDLGSDCFIWSCGFRRHRVGCMSFWVRRGDPPPPWRGAEGGAGRWRKQTASKPEPPLVFVHGVGLGLVTYLPFLRGLFGISRHRTVVLLELPHVSMKLGIDRFPTIQAIADYTEQAMHQLRLPAALWVCHSLGTFVFAGINRLKPHLIDACVLIDPVCFMLWEATTMKNFCYCAPRSPLEIVQQYHVCRELLISWYFQRHFYFSDAVLLREDVPTRALVVISQADNIYDTSRVIQYLRRGGVRLQLFPDTPHGGWLLSAAQTSSILHAVATLYHAGADAGAGAGAGAGADADADADNIEGDRA